MGGRGGGTANTRTGGGGPRGTNVVKTAPNGDVSIGDVATFGNGALVITDRNVNAVRAGMGQTGWEAGTLDSDINKRTYIGSGKSYNMNEYLRTDGKKYKTGQSPYWDRNNTPAQIRKDIKSVDKGMKPLNQDTKLYRFERGDMLGDIMAKLGIKAGINRNNIDGLIRTLKTDPQKLKDFSDGLKNGGTYENKGYSSFTYEDSHVGFGNYAVQFRVVQKQGSRAIVTRNIAEHEVLGAHGLKYNFTGGVQIQHKTGITRNRQGVATRFSRDQLIIDVTVDG